MGANSPKIERHLTNEEINMVLNEKLNLKIFFENFKSSDGVLTQEELSVITNNLLEEYILNRIIIIFGTRGYGLTSYDFFYFYALLNTSSATAKLQFILDFIFCEKDKIDKEEYILNIKRYFYNSGVIEKILMSEEIFKNNKEGNKIKREDIFNYIMNHHAEDIINYKLFINNNSNADNITVSENPELISSETQVQNIGPNKLSKLIEDSDMDSEVQVIENNELINNKNETLLIVTEMSKNNLNEVNNNNSFISNAIEDKDKNKENNKDKQTTLNKAKSSMQQNSIIIPRIKLERINRNEKLKKAFNKIIKEENGVFPIDLFEKMLKEINVIQSLIDVIGNFLRQKSQKTFINFQIFKEILNLIIIPDTNFTLIEDEKNNEANKKENNKTNNNINSKNETMGNANEKTKEEIIDGLFTLFAYPNNFIYKKNFFLFAKSTKPELSSNTIKEWFNKYKIEKLINKQKFKEIIEFIFDELYESFEHIKYLPYIFFKFDITDKKIEKKCIDVLLKNRSLDEYFQERLQYEEEFYIIDKEFWDKWNASMNSNNINRNMQITPKMKNNLSINITKELSNANTSIANLKNNIPNNDNANELSQNNLKLNSTNPLPHSQKNENKEPQLHFNLEKIADKDGKLKEGLVYMKDFVVLTKRMFSLFYRWYGSKKDVEIKRNKIYLEDENDIPLIEKDNNINNKNGNINSNLFPSNNESSNKISISKIHLNNLEKISLNSTRNNLQTKGLTKNYSYLKGVNQNTHQRFELEIYPIFLSFFNFIELTKKDCPSMTQLIDNLKESYKKNEIKYYPFSRKKKYIELLKLLQTSLKRTLNATNARLWLFYKNSFDLCNLNDTIEKTGIVNKAIIVLEINDNNFWPSEKLKKEGLNKIKEKNLNLVGLANIGNTCYMNSILQIFLNNVEIKKIFLDRNQTDNKFNDFIINKKKGKSSNGDLICEFINLLNEKYVKLKKTITPKKFKEICGNYNATFKDYEQQDAHDFYTFLLDNLHEETNIKSSFKKQEIKEDSDSIDTTELELSNECWANSIRRNASYFYDLFFGQMKSTLTCKDCNKVKIKYENFSAVELPILEGKKIILEITLFRLPFTLSPFYKTENININDLNPNLKLSKNYNISTKKTADMTTNYPINTNNKQTTKNQQISSANEENNELVNNNYYMNLQETKGNLRKKLKKLKISNLGKYAENICSSLNLDPEILNNVPNEDNKYQKIKGGNNNESINKDQTKLNEESNLNTALYEKFNKDENDNGKIYEIINKKKVDKLEKDSMISNPLNLNIPVKLRIEIERNKKVGEIIDTLRKMDELKLEKNPQYTQFVILGNNKVVKNDSSIDENFLYFEEVYVYELLNYEGVKKIFGYNDLITKAKPLDYQNIHRMLDITVDNGDLKSINESQINKKEKTKEIKQVKDMNKKDGEINIELKNKDNLDNENCENLVAIFHEFYSPIDIEKIDEHCKIFNININTTIDNNLDFIILTNKNAIKPVDLYEIIWEKYMYFLNSPSKYESSLWWKPYSFSRLSSSKNLKLGENTNNQNRINNAEPIVLNPKENKRYYPFGIKLVKKSTRACIFCPWFRLCQGCVLNPTHQNYLSLPSDYLIIVEWRRDVIIKDVKDENISYILRHSSIKKTFETSQNEEEKKNIYDCLDLFTREETVKNIFCEKCNKKTNFKKRLLIDKFPKYLTLILKRFKYTKMYTSKIDNLIQFPLENLDMTNYITPKEGKVKYNLFGVVNHVGTLSGGHYHCDIKQDNKWIKYDDSYTYEYDKKIMTENAYLLIYKLAETKNIYNEVIRHEFKLNLLGLIDTAYKIYLKQFHFEHFFNYVYENNNSDMDALVQEHMDNCKYYYGEPITVNGKMGFLINIHKAEEGDKVYIKIKVKKGYYETNVSEQKVIKETVRITEESIQNETTDEKGKYVQNEQQSQAFCGSCVIC